MIFGVLLTLLIAATAQADPEPGVPQPEGPTAEKLETSVQLDFSPSLTADKVDPALVRADGRQVVIVRLSQNSAGQTVGENNGGKSSSVRSDQVMASDASAQNSVAAANAQQEAVMQNNSKWVMKWSYLSEKKK